MRVMLASFLALSIPRWVLVPSFGGLSKYLENLLRLWIENHEGFIYIDEATRQIIRVGFHHISDIIGKSVYCRESPYF